MTTPRLGAPELVVAQDVPETTVNEQVRFVEQGATRFLVVDKDLATPPGSPADGACYIVAGSPTGAWSGWATRLAFYAAGWKSVIAQEGMRAYVQDENTEYEFNGTSWATASIAVGDGDKGDITVSSSGTAWAIDNDAVTYAKMQNVSAASKLLGRGDSGAGDPQEITIGSGLTMTGTTLSASGGGGSGIDVEEDGSSEGTGITTLNFTTGLDVSVTGTEATISASGGGGSGYGFEDTPTVPNTSGYTLQNTGTASMANANGSRGIALTTPTATDNVRFVRKNGAPPATPYSLILRAAPISPRHGGTSRMCVILRNSTSGRLITWGKQDDFNLYAQRWASYTSSGGNILLQTGCVFSRMMNWMKISNDGTTLTFSCGPDGENWFDLTTEALATYINASGGSVDEIGFGTTTQSAGFTVVDLFQSFEVV
jgi:hypothetical protein